MRHTAHCKYCANIDTSGQIKSKRLKRNFPAKSQVCCKSHNLVYCLTCTICGLQYVGQTKRTFHERLYEHFRVIQNKDLTKPLGRHFALPNHSPDTTRVTSHILAFITKTQQYQCSPRNASQIRARLDFPTPDKSPPWPQCDGLTVPVPLSLLPYSTFFNPMNLMGLGRGAKDIIPPVKHPLMLTHLPTNNASTPLFECWHPSYQPSRH